jgi:hypothetical protein
MAVVVIDWPTTPHTANSYVSVATANTYFNLRLDPDAIWSAATTDLKGQAVITATRMIDRQRWQGTVTTATDPLQWPRTGVHDKYGNALSSTTLPSDLVLGCYELAYGLLQDSTLQNQAVAGSNTKLLKAGSVEIQYFRSTIGQVGKFPQIINELLAQFLAGSVSTGVASGADRTTQFPDDQMDIVDDLGNPIGMNFSIDDPLA